jgi:hypothetical protein
VRYAEFRDQLEAALRQEGLFFTGANRRSEKIDLADTVRSWKVHVFRAGPDDTEPFYVSAAIGFKWSPVDAARAHTTEEDLLIDLVGRRGRLPRTAPRWMRVDLSMHASLPYGATTEIPESSLFGAWTTAVVERANAAFAEVRTKDQRVLAVRGGHGDLELHARCDSQGVVSLSGIALSAFRIVRVPRAWDSPERRTAEADPARELGRLARTFRAAIDDWGQSIAALATWIRYSPPPSGAKPPGSWPDDRSDDDEGGPHNLH